MNTDLVKLLKLKQLDDRRLSTKQNIQDILNEIDSIEKTLAGGSNDVAEVKSAIEQMKKLRDRMDLDVKTIESHINKLKGQLLQAKTNREYETLRTEIGKLQADSSRIEDKIIQAMVDLDVLNETLDRNRKAVQKGRQELELTKVDQQVQIKQLTEQLDSMNRQRQVNLQDLPADAISMYERVLALRGDTAMAMVDPDQRICQGCFSLVTLQKISELMLGKELVLCERCNRFLYLPPVEQTDPATAAIDHQQNVNPN